MQSPVKDLYFKYRRSSSGSRSASLKLTQQGVLVALFEDGTVKAELFFEFSSVTYVEALKFSPVKTSSERKPKAIFVPVDESKGPVPEKHAFLLEKNFHFLISSTHPPLVVCVVRRPQGVKALDCHVFALDTVENSLHIAALIGSTQIPAGMRMEPPPGDLNRGRGSFERKARGDVIRTEYGEYSIYRGPGHYEPPPHSHGGQPQFFPGPGPAGPSRNGHSPMGGPSPSGVVPGGVMLTQDDFHRPQQIPPQQKSPYAPEGGGVAFVYDQQMMGQRPDILHGRQRSGDSADETSGALNRSFGGSAGGGGVAMRYEDGNARNSGNRLSGGQIPPQMGGAGGGKLSPRPQDLSSSQRYSGGGGVAGQFSPRSPDVVYSPGQQPSPRGSGSLSPRSPAVFSPTSPRGFDPSANSGGGGPVYSASNLESRGNAESPDDRADEYSGAGRPVAKVPPHMKAGIKVLPTDFRMVKLKPKADKKSESSDESGYDNNKELLNKYKELQEHERDTTTYSSEGGGSGGRAPAKTNSSNYPDGDGFRDFSDPQRARYPSEMDRDFASRWNDRSSVELRSYDNNNQGGQRSSRYEDNNNKARYSGHMMDDRRGNTTDGGQTNYGMMTSQYDNGGPQASTKDAEIANMFSNFHIQSGGPGPDMALRQKRERNEFEEGLGYLP